MKVLQGVITSSFEIGQMMGHCTLLLRFYVKFR